MGKGWGCECTCDGFKEGSGWAGESCVTTGSFFISLARGRWIVDLFWEKNKSLLTHWYTNTLTHCLRCASKTLILYSTHNPTNPLRWVKASVKVMSCGVMPGQNEQKPLSHSVFRWTVNRLKLCVKISAQTAIWPCQKTEASAKHLHFPRHAFDMSSVLQRKPGKRLSLWPDSLRTGSSQIPEQIFQMLAGQLTKLIKFRLPTQVNFQVTLYSVFAFTLLVFKWTRNCFFSIKHENKI